MNRFSFSAQVRDEAMRYGALVKVRSAHLQRAEPSRRVNATDVDTQTNAHTYIRTYMNFIFVLSYACLLACNVFIK